MYIVSLLSFICQSVVGLISVCSWSIVIYQRPTVVSLTCFVVSLTSQPCLSVVSLCVTLISAPCLSVVSLYLVCSQSNISNRTLQFCYQSVVNLMSV